MTAGPTAAQYEAEIIRAHNEDTMAPGSRWAQAHGCTCPSLDSWWRMAHVRWPAGDWSVTADCRVHSGVAVDSDPTPPRGVERPSLRGASS